jgi:hypothetical protein
MTQTQTHTYVVRPVDADVLAELRVRDDAGREPELVVDVDGGNPLRCCLRLGRPGERMLLASYAPLRRWAAATGADPGAYLELGPVFIHAEPCAGPDSTGWPAEMRGLPRVLRAYDDNGRILGGRVVDETHDADAAIAEVLGDPGVAFVHARALVAGCFTFAIDRARS